MQVKTGTYKINRTQVLTNQWKINLKNHNISEISAKKYLEDA